MLEPLVSFSVHIFVVTAGVLFTSHTFGSPSRPFQNTHFVWPLVSFSVHTFVMTAGFFYYIFIAAGVLSLHMFVVDAGVVFSPHIR